MNESQANTLVVTLVTVANLLIAFLISGVVIWILGEDPWFALKTMLYGAFGYDEGLGYTLYYTTNFIFTGLAFAIGFHCGTRQERSAFVPRNRDLNPAPISIFFLDENAFSITT